MSKGLQLPTNELLLLLQEKNVSAVSYLYDQYASMIYGIIVREIQNSKLATDILKSTFLNIIKECNTLDCVKQSVFAWLLTLTKRTAFTEFKTNIEFKSLVPTKNANKSNYQTHSAA